MTRDELAKLLGEFMWSNETPASMADRILSQYDLHPKGSVVVPAEPTEEMLRAAHQKIDWCRTKQNNTHDMNSPPIDGVGTTCRQDLFDAYRAMLAARPRSLP